MARTYPPSAGSLSGSTTTLVFPSDRDGFVVLAESRFAHFEGFALVRRIASGPNAERFAWRGIHAQRPIWAENLALLNWQRGIDLDGRATHPEHPEIPDTFNADYSHVSRIFAEHCFWATYAHGPGAQGCHFEHVVAVDCEAGIFDGSQSGNGYVDCYVFSGGKTEPPYYMKNQSVLMNCHCESPLPPQLHQDTTSIGSSFNVGTLPPNVAKALNVTGGDFLQINGTPAKQAGKPFPAPVASFAGSEKVAVTVDGMQRVVTFADGSFTPHQVAAQINAAFADLGPSRGYCEGFINSITIEGWRGHKGSLSVEGSAETLTKIGFPAVPQDAYRPCLLLSSKESANVTFRGYSGPGPDSVGTDHQLSVTMARDGRGPCIGRRSAKTGTMMNSGCSGPLGTASDAGHSLGHTTRTTRRFPSPCRKIRWVQQIRWVGTSCWLTKVCGSVAVQFGCSCVVVRQRRGKVRSRARRRTLHGTCLPILRNAMYVRQMVGSLSQWAALPHRLMRPWNIH
ncbi:hypothetical protein SGLAM104S_02594 [Streptomyces glaucescens]